MSKSHIRSNLIIGNSLLGVDESLVAYFPFKHSPNDIINGLEPSINSSNTLVKEGIIIEGSTTNCIYSNWLVDNKNPWGRDTADVEFTVTNEDSYAMNYSTIWTKASKAGTGNCYINGGGDIDQSKTSLSWTFSCYLKRSDGAPVTNVGSVYMYMDSASTGARINSNKEPTSINYISDGWYHVTRTDTALEPSTISLIGFSSLDGTTDWLFSGWQLEQHPFASSFVNGSRSAGNLDIPINLGVSDFTILGEFTPNADSDMLSNGSYFLSLGNGMTLRTYNQVPYIDGNTITGASNQNVHIDYNTTPRDKVYYVIRRLGTTFSWRMVNDSGSDITWTKTHEVVPTHSVSTLDFAPSWGGIHKNVFVFNRALSDNEILQLYTNKDTFYSSNEEVIML